MSKHRTWWLTFLPVRAIYEQKPGGRWPGIEVIEVSAVDELKKELMQIQTCPICNTSTISSSGTAEYQKQMDPYFKELDQLRSDNTLFKMALNKIIDADYKIGDSPRICASIAEEVLSRAEEQNEDA